MQAANENIRVLCLGAGQDVGRSCVCVTLGDRTIMFDVGIHMLYNDHRRYPEFSQLYSGKQNINDTVDLVIITHFHLDHCGALPYLTQKHGYSGPILCSTPTKALLPIMLEDYRKVMSDKKEEQFYSFGVPEVKNSTDRVRSMGLFQTVSANGIQVTSYYAGHVLGACMYHVEYDGLSAVYTGDYNSYADRHLGAACAPRLRPNILLTETTYATTIRDTKRERQRAMLQLITQTVDKGGKVLIPVFALGRAQELAVLLETYWKRTESSVPIYFSAGLIEKANLFYRLFVDWQNEKIQEDFENGDNVFQFKKVKPFDKSLIRADTPYVLFATPGMLHSGTSVQVFKEWCEDERNTLIIPGYCVEGTLGNRLLSGAREVTLDKKTYQVKMSIKNVSFSAHADAKGIINLLRNIDPDEVIFVHGDKNKMANFKPLVEEQLKRRVHMPANHVPLLIRAAQTRKVRLDDRLASSEGILAYSNGAFSCLATEKEMLREVNRIMYISGLEVRAVRREFSCTFYAADIEQLQKLQGRAKESKSVVLWKSQDGSKREEEEGESRGQGYGLKIEGEPQSMLSFLGKHPQ